MKSFEKALQLNPTQITALGLITDMLVREGRHDAAMAACEEQKRNVSENAVAMAEIEFIQGNISMAKGEQESAKAHFKMALELNSENLPAYMALARIYSLQKMPDEAVTQYLTVLEKDPKHLSATMALGMLYEQQKDLEKAEKYYRMALEIRKEYVPAANNLAFILADKGEKLTEAAVLAEFAKAKRPRDFVILDTLGWVYYQQGRYVAAVDELKEAVKLKPDYALANYHLGWAYYDLGEFTKAREFMRKALDIDPDFEGADQARSIVGE
jgi:tetratricopeptide (TPR) repeat protein